MKKLCFILFNIIALSSCLNSSDTLISVGVSKELADHRKNAISNLIYDLHFDIPANISDSIVASATIQFDLAKKESIILDFKPEYKGSGVIGQIEVNGFKTDPVLINEHLLIPGKYAKKGQNSVSFSFRAGEQSLNRRQNLLYTLLVPDRARTLFPCFDQPNLKAAYNLSLTIPFGWDAVANGALSVADTIENNRVTLKYNTTDPIPTYLFSFVAGTLSKMTAQKGERTINAYHQESDSVKLAQWEEISSQIFYSLEWLEEYTGIAYPFEKYDIAIIPGFQYGGMEHTGATLYSDRTMFIEKGATLIEKMERAKLIAHETAHMWFGDYVTMSWFDDVWTKEVFANWFASQIITPLYPEVDHKVSFVNSYFPASYAEDRTAGSNAIQQKLDNLNNAGLVYGNIIYNKAPIVMEKLVRKVGYDRFRDGIKEYLTTYAYSNATWNQLIDILDKLSPEDLREWSRVWVEERGRPHIRATYENGEIKYFQSDPFGRALVWEQDIVSDSVINSDGMGYGLFILTKDEAKAQFAELAKGIPSDEVSRLSVIINLYENMEEGYITPDEFLYFSSVMLGYERDPLIYSRIIGYTLLTIQRYISPYENEIHKGIIEEVEKSLWSIYANDSDKQRRIQAFRALQEIFITPEMSDRLFTIWDKPEEQKQINAGERDLMKLSYELAIRMPDRWDYIYSRQISRIRDNERRDEFRYIWPATSPDPIVRDSVFNSLQKRENREIEPRASASLALLNHFTRSGESVKFITPSLNLIEEIQRTGDIFFPRDWLRSLLGSHSSQEAKIAVSDFLTANKELNPMIVSKIKQQSNHLFRDEKAYKAE